jgi:hypothetical protein
LKHIAFPAKSYDPYYAMLSEQWAIVINWSLLTTSNEIMKLPALDSALGFTSEKENGKSQV